MDKINIETFGILLSKSLCVLCVFCGVILSVKAQSTDQSFPTAITTNQISGTIPARDIGDARLTTFYYVFGGEQGDIFVNVVTKNFDGDIDIFTANGLKPLTKIKVFSDNADNETGRIIYLRQPEKLILRVEGRSPNDEPATFQVKFAGSFLAEKTPTENNNAPQVKSENQSDVRVNSVGTIIEIKPKPTPQPKETPAKTETDKTVKENKIEEKAEATEKKEEKQEEKTTESKTETKEEKPSVVVVVTDNLEKSKEEKTEEKTEKVSENKTEKVINPLENIKLTVVFKNGTKIERPMSEILKVGVDKGILTIIQKDGKIGRYSILDVTEMTIK
ncbi:hypothetical protein BH10ACI1_BH10ACI1_09160 [soil metagenome]